MAELSGTVLVTGASVAERYLDELRSAGLTVSNPVGSFPPATLDEDALRCELSGAVAYIVGGDEWVSKGALASAADLEVVAFLGVGYEQFVDVDGATELAIPVTNTPGACSSSVAEFTIGHLLNETRRIAAHAASHRAGAPLVLEQRRELAGHPIGIVGLGATGTRIAEILVEGFGAEVSYFSRTRKVPEERRLGIRYLELRELVASVEALIVMVPQTSETLNLIDGSVLGARPASAGPLQIINTARAEVTDPAALLEGLDGGRLESVALDGYYRTATAASVALERHERVSITPHIASLTHDARDAMSQMCIDSVFNALRGLRDPHIVNDVAPVVVADPSGPPSLAGRRQRRCVGGGDS